MIYHHLARGKPLVVVNGMQLTFRRNAQLHISISAPIFTKTQIKKNHRRMTTRRTTPTMMPEGPEVRTLIDQLQPAVGMRLLKIEFLSGRYVTHGKPFGCNDFTNTMSSEKGGIHSEEVSDNDNVALLPSTSYDVVTEWNAKGKFIWMTLSDDRLHNNPKKNKDITSDENESEQNNINTTFATASSNSVVKDNDDYKRSIWITLGMSGRFLNDKHPKIEKARWSMHLLNTETGITRKIYYFDPRNFGTLKFSLSSVELAKKIQTLGYDILARETTVDNFLEVVYKTKNENMNICKLLMDQKKLCGIGNYILAEGLYRANIDPFACIKEISTDQLRILYDELRNTAIESYSAQGMTRSAGGSYRDADGNKGKFEFELQCYGRKTCTKRGKPVIREINGPHGRTIWYVEDQLFLPRNMRNDDGTIINHKETTPTKEIIEKNMTKQNQKRIHMIDLSYNLVDERWKNALADSFSSDQFQQLSEFILTEQISGHTIYPPENEIFSALNLCPLDKVKVVIVGQDPYHGYGQGHGLAFSVRKGVPIPPSLKNIFQEIDNDVGLDFPITHGNLESWAKQGVLLLNSVLTVRQGKANSHSKMGWEKFTDDIIAIINSERDHVVFLLWGNPAAKKVGRVDETKHTVIKCSHPSPLGATKTKTPFFGSRCFSRANTALQNFGLGQIDWNVF